MTSPKQTKADLSKNIDTTDTHPVMTPDLPIPDTPDETTSLLPRSPRPIEEESPGTEEPTNISPPHQSYRILPALAIGVFLAAADQTIVVSSYGQIGSELHALNSTSWLATGYLLTLTSLQPLYGRLSTILGRKPLLLLAFTLFLLGSLCCALARSMPQLIAARALAGMGGAGFNTLAAVVLSDMVPVERRGLWQGWRRLVFATGLGVGALGGVLTDALGWRVAFWVQVPVILVAILVVCVADETSVPERSDWKVKVAQIDFGGAAALVLAVSTLLIGLDHGSNRAWASSVTILCLIASAMFIAGLGYIELSVAREPFVPSFVLRDRTLLASSICNFLAYGAALSMTYYLPLYWQAAEGLSATDAALRLLPGIIVGTAGSPIAGWIMLKNSGKYYIVSVVAYVAFAVSFVPLILFTGFAHKSLWGIWVGTTLGGFALNVGSTSTLVATMMAADNEDQAVAISCLHLFCSLGSEISLALSTVVVQQYMHKTLQSSLGDDSLKKILQDLGYLDKLEPDIRDAVRRIYATAVRWSLVFDLCLAAGALMACSLMREKRAATRA